MKNRLVTVICLVVSLLIMHLRIASAQGPEKSYLNKSYNARQGKLTDKELKMARIAWKYFENNYQPATGLVNAADDYPSVSMWDLGSYLGGLVSALELGVIDKNVFDVRMVTILKTFNELKFFRGELPNKVYNTKTAEKVNYSNKPGEIGFSALDLGRVLVWLKIIKERYPQYGSSVDNFVLRWKFTNVLDKEGTMYGAALNDKKEPIYLQEGRLGYEEYSAKGFQLWGFNTEKASKVEPLSYISMYDIYVPYDSRDPRKLGAHNYVVTENYVLDAIEFNWDLPLDRTSDNVTFTDKRVADFAQRIYLVQEKRYQETGIITARTEHQLDGAPYFVYDAIYSDGYPWNTITESGKFVPEFAAVALKGALGIWVVRDTDYSNLVFNYVSDLYDPEKGFYEGVYENGKGLIKEFTANNNGIILECLYYKQAGKLLRFGTSESLWDKKINDEFIKLNGIRERLKKKDK